MSIKRAYIQVCAIFFILCPLSSAQSEKSFYGGLFYLSELIASKDFAKLRTVKSDTEMVDYLFEQAVSYFDEDISESLLCLTFSTLPFKAIQFKLPFGIGIMKIPLPSPPQKMFAERLDNLPSQLFFNSPKNSFGDKDKLAHFFGNAFLHHNISVFNFSKFMGIFVEEMEQNFFANGELDSRDIIANHLGELFSEMLKNNSKSKPSEALLVYQLLFFRVNP